MCPLWASADSGSSISLVCRHRIQAWSLVIRIVSRVTSVGWSPAGHWSACWCRGEVADVEYFLFLVSPFKDPVHGFGPPVAWRGSRFENFAVTVVPTVSCSESVRQVQGLEWKPRDEKICYSIIIEYLQVYSKTGTAKRQHFEGQLNDMFRNQFQWNQHSYW